jgi:hypothetical protein
VVEIRQDVGVGGFDTRGDGFTDKGTAVGRRTRSFWLRETIVSKTLLSFSVVKNA